MDHSSVQRNLSIETDTVLVVDDDGLQCGEIVDFLNRQGIDAVSENNGFAAYHRIKNIRPRVVVMDMKMPGLDGLHLSRLVKKLDNAPKVILMSGFPEYIYRAHAEDTDIFAVFEKPVPLAILVRFINDALNRLAD
jgi:DNA-binding NtrC family response regulator